MNISSVFEPASIAIIGASTRVGTVGNDIVRNLVEQGFDGEIFPVNPKATELYGKVCYGSIADVPAERVDMAIFVIPAAAVPAALEEAAVTKHIQSAVVISAGFKEMGNTDLEEALAAVARQYDIALVGPNCLGVLNPARGMNASFAKTMPAQGSVAFLSQSGALVTAVLDYAQSIGLGFSRFASTGNKAVLDEEKLLEYLEHDEATRVIGMYVEDLKNPQALRTLAQRMTRGPQAKPIIVIKSGRTQAGASASASHTGSLAGSDASYDALFTQAGIIRTETIDAFFGALQICAHNPLLPGRRIAVITNAGGPGVLATDALIKRGLSLATLTPATEQALQAVLPAAANTHNPVDVLGDARADRYEAALQAVTADAGVDGVLVLLTPQSMTEIEATAQAIIAARERSGKPIAVSFMGSVLVRPGVEALLQQGVAAFRFPEAGADALGVLADFSDITRRTEAQPFVFSDIDHAAARAVITSAQEAGVTQIPEAQAVPFFAAYGFRTLRSYVVRSVEEAQTRAAEFSGPVVLKIVSPDILHKSDVGGVWVGVELAQAGEAYTELMTRVAERAPEAHLEGVLMVEMAPRTGMEIVLGSVQDPVFGQLAMVGLGGIFVEVFKDVAFGLTPFDRVTARRMIDQLKSRSMLDGVRGGARLDIEALVEALGRLSQLLTDFPEIKELDINPLLVLPEGQGTVLLDARLVLNAK